MGKLEVVWRRLDDPADTRHKCTGPIETLLERLENLPDGIILYHVWQLDTGDTEANEASLPTSNY